MKIKNISLMPLIASAVVLLNTSCRFEEDELFDKSASLRVQATNDELKSLLVSQSSDANNGWVIQYFVAGTDEADFEGFNLFGRFYDNGKVTLASDHRYLRNGNANKYTEATSFYKITSEEGTLLSFPIWNDVLSVFADPVDPAGAPSVLNSDGEGMNGDYNLVLHSMKKDTIVFRGQRHQAEVRFVKCDRSWQDYITAVSDLKKKISNTSLKTYYVTDGDSTRYFSNLNSGIIAYTERIDNPLDKQTATCLFTPKGFRLNRVAKLGDHSFQEFTIAEDSTSLVSEDGAVKVIPTWDSYMIGHTAIWKMDQEMFNAEQKDLFDKIATEIKKFNSSWSLESIGIGKSSGSNSVLGLVLTFYTNAAKTKTNNAGVSLTMTKADYGQMTISYTSEEKVDKNMESIVKKAPDVETYARLFANLLNGIYNMTPNDYFLPTGGKYDAINGGISFVLK